MISQPSYAMRSRSDIVAYLPDHRPVLVVDCKGMSGISPQRAALWRSDLIADELLSDTSYFLFASTTDLFLWLERAPPDELPNFSAPIKSVLHVYLGARAENNAGTGNGGLELILFSWIGDLAYAMHQPDPNSEADQMIVRSGLYDKLRRARVKFEDVP